MANQRQIFLDKVALKEWRKVLPGVHDEEIVLPRYHARWTPLPLPPHHTDDPDRWKLVDLYGVVWSCSWFSADVTGGDKTIYDRTCRIAAKKMRQAMRWWRTFRRPTLLKVQQELYSRKNHWKDIQDLPEFLACHALVRIWLYLPKRHCQPADIASKTKPLLKAAIEKYAMECPNDLITPSRSIEP